MGKTAIIFGVTGQDGSYLSELLLQEGYRVVGVSRRVSVPTTERLTQSLSNPNFRFVEGDVTDAMCVYRIIEAEVPKGNGRLEVYNLAAQSHVATSFAQPSFTTDVTYKGCLNCLEAIRQLPNRSFIRFYQASSSEMYGSSISYEEPESYEYPERRESNFKNEHLSWMLQNYQGISVYQDELTPFAPCSPYAVAKLAAHHLVNVYRQSYGLFACSGILFNHESPRRGELFVTRKITKWVANAAILIQNGQVDSVPYLKLGNLEARRDWGHAKDYVRGMWMMLQHSSASDYVLATGESHSVEDFLYEASHAAGLSYDWVYKNRLELDSSLHRPCEVPYLKGDASKAQRVLGWKPEISFGDLVGRMVDCDMGKGA